MKKKSNTKPKKRPRLQRSQVPNSTAVAAINGMLDAVSGAAEDAGLKTEVPALRERTDDASRLRDLRRAVFGMLIAGALESSKGTTIDVDGIGPIKIRPVDAHAVGMSSFADYTRLLTSNTLRDRAKKK